MIRARATALGVSIEGAELVDYWNDEARRERYALEFYRRRQRKGLTLAVARARMRHPVYFGCMMVLDGQADGLLAGEDMHYPETIRPALETIGTAPGVRRVAGLYMMVTEADVAFFADTTVNIDPDAEALADVALLSAAFVRRLGLEARVAMLSFSNFGSVQSSQSERVRRATALVKERAPELQVDGEMQADTAALDEFRLENYPFTTLRDRPNVFVFPNLDAANIAYKLMWRMGKAEAFGPILLGMARPIHVLQRGSAAVDVLNLTALAVVDAQEDAGQ